MKKQGLYFLISLLFLFVICGNILAAEADEGTRTDKYVIVIDPGHGGSEAGASATFNGVTYREEVITWKIARYIQIELQKYPNIEVHLTRNVFNMRMGLYERVKVGFDLNADLLVSIHIDSMDNETANGASLLISNGNYRPDLAEKERFFGTLLKAEFSKIGLNWRGYLERDSENGSVYPNGTKRDYYGIVASSVEHNLPGMIVEHCFITNPSDVSRFLSSNSRIKKLAIADANAIVEYCRQVEKVPERTGWIYENGNSYYYKDGVLLKNTLLKFAEGTYYLDEYGRRASGWQTVNGKTYYFDQTTGLAKKGWMVLNKKRYYFSSTTGIMFQNFMSVSKDTGKKRYFDENGVLVKDQLITYKGKSYYMGSDYYAVKGFKKLDGKTYYFSAQGYHMVKSRKLINSKGWIYYLDENGVRAEKKFVTIKEGTKNNVYYFGSNGVAYIGWHTINGNRYYFSTSGKMAKNGTLTNSIGRVYVFDANGVLIDTYMKK